MELKICCENEVKIDNFLFIREVDAQIGDYKIENTTLNGDVDITVKYQKNTNLNNIETLEKKVPFTIIFKKDNSSIKKLKINEFKYYEIANEGIQCSFEIIVFYEFEEIIDNIDINIPDNEIKEIDIFENNDSPGIEEMQIKEKYDNLLKDVFSNTIVTKEINDKTNNLTYDNKNKDKEKVRFSNSIEEKKGIYHIYYPKQESDIDKICNDEKIAIKNVYNDSLNKDFANKKRIIIK